MFYALMGIVVTAVAILMYNHQSGELFGYPIEAIGSVAVLSTLLLFLLSGRGSRRSAPPLKSLKYLVLWAALGLLLVLGYSFKDDARMLVSRVTGELVPGSAMVSSDGSVSFRRSAGGHFQVSADVNGSSLSMLVDSGASAVVLTRDDAEAIGIDTARLNYIAPVSTANGRTFTAPIVLDSISVGGLQANNVRAMVAQDGALRESLLGMSYLDRLGSWSVSGDRLTMSR
ncbi:aspartyl protease family protein [Cohaesibacter marisflavi]|uniref:Aspartyl protease family protein n=1 Tax=Cohaesibacter marisflavi TaxID=655353 RepID=A0A1I5ATR9_9HYPH|nr:TIGR02281 family clan AA aspartic protease [Cohaesibacter marisflavi]SFN65824.1 aspartyl protease family protein [Cohaesibacter marisflavi]